MSELPEGWQQLTLGASCKIMAGFGFPERLQGNASGDLAFYKVGDISEAWKRGDVRLTKANHYISEPEAREIRAKPLPENTTVFAKIGAAIALNRRAILSEPSLVDNNVMGLHPINEALDHKYLFHFFCTIKLGELSRATTVPSVRKSDIEQIVIPVPPVSEQLRIVAEIEKQFTRLEVGVAALRRVQANLKRYRAAVLKAACEGRLVPTEVELAEAEKRKTKFESGEALLARILTERRTNWQRRGKYKEPVVPDASELGQIPKGWTWARIGQLFECIVPNRDKPRSFTGEIPWITLPDFSEHSTIKSTISQLGLSKREVEENHARLIPSGSVVMSCIGRFGLVAKLGQDSVINQQLHAFLIPQFLPPEYFVYALRVQKAYMERISTSTTIAYLNKDNCNSVPIPLPPVAEQIRIVAEVERRLSVIDELEAVVSSNLRRATCLRQSILKKAFTGQLIYPLAKG